MNGVRLTIQRYSHTPQGAGGSCEWPQRTSINPYSSRPLIPASGRTPVHPREPGAVRHPPHTCATAESCAQTCMPPRPDPDASTIRVSSAATASTDHACSRPPSTNYLQHARCRRSWTATSSRSPGLVADPLAGLAPTPACGPGVYQRSTPPPAHACHWPCLLADACGARSTPPVPHRVA